MQRRVRPLTVVLIVASVVLLAGVAMYIDWRRDTQPPIVTEVPNIQPGMLTLAPFAIPARIRPPTISAAQATLADDDEVIGVVINQHPRAYRLKALLGVQNHVVNDLLDGVPVSVTYCDERNCIRIFTGDGKEPLKIRSGGYNMGMILMADGAFYAQATRQPLNEQAAPFPYDAMDFERTTWAKWRATHPTTDVYEAPPPPKKTPALPKEAVR